MILSTLKAKRYFQTIDINDSVWWVKFAVWSDRSTYQFIFIERFHDFTRLHWFSKFAELHKMWRCIKPCTSALFSFDKFTMKNKDNYKEQPSNIQRVSPCIALPVWGKLSGRQQWQKQTNQGTQTGAAKKHWDWNSFLKSYSSSSSAMFTAGNMTYMRKRKKERQAAKRAMARENVSLWNP